LNTIHFSPKYKSITFQFVIERIYWDHVRFR
jgi:hypothetical protein